MDAAEFGKTYETLTPFQQIIVEVLIARYRLGERLWTFSSDSHTVKSLKTLEARGLVWTMSGTVERTVRAGLSLESVSALGTYRAPIYETIWQEGYDAAKSDPPNPYRRG